jgi:transcriptional regulator with XRE-family HTH domain
VSAETTLSQPLGDFLRSCRARVSPGDVGLFAGRRRRVQGLRREELAGLAGLSADYYARLEQGRHSHPSLGVLNAIADVLQLSPAERDLLQHLARPAEQPVQGQVARQETVNVLWALGATPAALVGPHMEILASNSAARRLFTDWDAMPANERNALRWMLCEPRARELLGGEWAAVAAELIGTLRLKFGRQPRDATAQHLVAELSAESELFRRVWSDQIVSAFNRPVKRFQHPKAGTIDMALEILNVPQSYDQNLFVMVAAPGSADDRAWREFMGRTADPAVTAITDMTG